MPSNTPIPPGTWLAIPRRTATRKAPRYASHGALLGRQQHVEHEAGQEPVRDRQGELPKRQGRRRQREGPSPDVKWCLPDACGNHVGHDGEHSSQPTPLRTWWPGSPAAAGSGTTMKLTPASASSPSQNVTE